MKSRTADLCRRDFLRLAGVLAATPLAILAACREAAQTVTATVTETLTPPASTATALSTATATRTVTSTVTTAPTSTVLPTTPVTSGPAPTTMPATTVPAASTSIVPLSSSLAARPFPGNIILGRPSDNAITLSLLADSDLEVYLRYGRASGLYEWHSQGYRLIKGQPLEARLTGLARDARYFYQLCHRGTGDTSYAAAGESSFHTQRAPGQPFAFTVDADPHFDKNSDLAELKTAFQNVLAELPDFNIDLGDTFMTEKLEKPDYQQVVAAYVDRRGYFGLFGSAVPLFLVNGNHDGELGWLLDGTASNEAVWATKARQLYFPNPAPDGFYTGDSREFPFVGMRRAFYAWEWGDALFVVLDPYWDAPDGKQNSDMWGMSLGKYQYDWLRDTLGRSLAKYKLVFTHHVLGNCRGGVEWCDYYEMGGRNKAGEWEWDRMRPGWEMPLHQLFVKNKVTAVFQGHDHLYDKQERDGIVYQEVPQPSLAAGLNGNANDGSYKSGVILPSPGHLRVSVGTAQLTVDYIHSALPADRDKYKNGEVKYSYTIEP